MKFRARVMLIILISFDPCLHAASAKSGRLHPYSALSTPVKRQVFVHQARRPAFYSGYDELINRFEPIRPISYNPYQVDSIITSEDASGTGGHFVPSWIQPNRKSSNYFVHPVHEQKHTKWWSRWTGHVKPKNTFEDVTPFWFLQAPCYHQVESYQINRMEGHQDGTAIHHPFRKTTTIKTSNAERTDTGSNKIKFSSLIESTIPATADRQPMYVNGYVNRQTIEGPFKSSVASTTEAAEKSKESNIGKVLKQYIIEQDRQKAKARLPTPSDKATQESYVSVASPLTPGIETGEVTSQMNRSQVSFGHVGHHISIRQYAVGSADENGNETPLRVVIDSNSVHPDPIQSTSGTGDAGQAMVSQTDGRYKIKKISSDRTVLAQRVIHEDLNANSEKRHQTVKTTTSDTRPYPEPLKSVTYSPSMDLGASNPSDVLPGTAAVHQYVVSQGANNNIKNDVKLSQQIPYYQSLLHEIQRLSNSGQKSLNIEPYRGNQLPECLDRLLRKGYIVIKPRFDASFDSDELGANSSPQELQESSVVRPLINGYAVSEDSTRPKETPPSAYVEHRPIQETHRLSTTNSIRQHVNKVGSHNFEGAALNRHRIPASTPVADEHNETSFVENFDQDVVKEQDHNSFISSQPSNYQKTERQQTKKEFVDQALKSDEKTFTHELPLKGEIWSQSGVKTPSLVALYVKQYEHHQGNTNTSSNLRTPVQSTTTSIQHPGDIEISAPSAILHETKEDGSESSNVTSLSSIRESTKHVLLRPVIIHHKINQNRQYIEVNDSSNEKYSVDTHRYPLHTSKVHSTVQILNSTIGSKPGIKSDTDKAKNMSSGSISYVVQYRVENDRKRHPTNSTVQEETDVVRGTNRTYLSGNVIEESTSNGGVVKNFTSSVYPHIKRYQMNQVQHFKESMEVKYDNSTSDSKYSNQLDNSSTKFNINRGSTLNASQVSTSSTKVSDGGINLETSDSFVKQYEVGNVAISTQKYLHSQHKGGKEQAGMNRGNLTTEYQVNIGETYSPNQDSTYDANVMDSTKSGVTEFKLNRSQQSGQSANSNDKISSSVTSSSSSKKTYVKQNSGTVQHFSSIHSTNQHESHVSSAIYKGSVDKHSVRNNDQKQQKKSGSTTLYQLKEGSQINADMEDREINKESIKNVVKTVEPFSVQNRNQSSQTDVSDNLNKMSSSASSDSKLHRLNQVIRQHVSNIRTPSSLTSTSIRLPNPSKTDSNKVSQASIKRYGIGIERNINQKHHGSSNVDTEAIRNSNSSSSHHDVNRVKQTEIIHKPNTGLYQVKRKQQITQAGKYDQNNKRIVDSGSAENNFHRLSPGSHERISSSNTSSLTQNSNSKISGFVRSEYGHAQVSSSDGDTFKQMHRSQIKERVTNYDIESKTASNMSHSSTVDELMKTSHIGIQKITEPVLNVYHVNVDQKPPPPANNKQHVSATSLNEGKQRISSSRTTLNITRTRDALREEVAGTASAEPETGVVSKYPVKTIDQFSERNQQESETKSFSSAQKQYDVDVSRQFVKYPSASKTIVLTVNRNQVDATESNRDSTNKLIGTQETFHKGIFSHINQGDQRNISDSKESSTMERGTNSKINFSTNSMFGHKQENDRVDDSENNKRILISRVVNGKQVDPGNSDSVELSGSGMKSTTTSRQQISSNSNFRGSIRESSGLKTSEIRHYQTSHGQTKRPVNLYQVQRVDEAIQTTQKLSEMDSSDYGQRGQQRSSISYQVSKGPSFTSSTSDGQQISESTSKRFVQSKTSVTSGVAQMLPGFNKSAENSLPVVKQKAYDLIGTIQYSSDLSSSGTKEYGHRIPQLDKVPSSSSPNLQRPASSSIVHPNGAPTIPKSIYSVPDASTHAKSDPFASIPAE